MLAAGNAMIFAERSHVVDGAEAGGNLHRSRLPDGAFNVVTGSGAEVEGT